MSDRPAPLLKHDVAPHGDGGPRRAVSGPILVLTTSAGAGHIMAARALGEAFKEAAPKARIQVLDILDQAPALFRNIYSGGYLHLVNVLPSLFGFLYESSDRPRTAARRLRSELQSISLRGAAKRICSDPPQFIVNTHFLSAELVAQLRREERLSCPQFTVLTDFEAHRMWVQAPTERYFVASTLARAHLEACGVVPEAVSVTGIPVRLEFEADIPQAEARRQLELHTDGAIVLLLCGGFGVGPVEATFRELLRVSGVRTVAVICGRNAARQRRLERIAESVRDRVRIVGYTDEIHLWMRAATLAVSKPGGLSSAEALTCGLPLVILNPIPGPETRNSDYLLEHRAGIKVNNRRVLAARVQELLENPGRLHSMRAAAAAAARPHAAREIVSAILSSVTEPV